MGKHSHSMSNLWTFHLVLSSFLLFTSCGSPSKESFVQTPAPEAADHSGEVDETPGKPQADQATTPTASSQSELSVTNVQKEEDGMYSATLNNAIVFKNLEIKKDDSGKELLFFPKMPGNEDRTYNIVYLEDRSIAGHIKDAIKAGKASGKGVPGAIKVTQVKWKALDRESKVKGFADVTLNNAITIKGCKLIDGKKGPWLAWPSVKKGKEYDDLVFAIDKGVREIVEAAVKKEAGL